MEVIDLTLDSSPPPKDSADVDQSGKRLRKEKRKERREAKHERRERKQHEEERQRSVGRKRSSRRDENDRERDRDGKRRRESPREREADRKRSRRSPSRERDRPIPFYVDDTPAQLPPEALYTVATIVEKDPQALILPAHVSVFGETPAALPEATLDSDEGDDYIEYLDYGNRKDFIRYYEDKPEDKRTRVVCKKCGAEGEHSTALCTVLICATCGVRDEHPTRNCNIGKICFGCGMKGHISMDCPNRLSRSRTQSRPGCDRCNALSHQTAECPSWWRLYEYVEDGEQVNILQTRKSKKGLALGQGGEGYIAGDAWCYNCGGSGHWGDDCREFYHQQPVTEPTAFSSHVLSAGPFSVPEEASDARPPPEWIREVPLPGGMEDVGRRGRKKEKEKLAQHAQQVADDPEDWFQRNAQKPKNRQPSERDRRDNPAPRAGSSKDPPPPPFVFKGAALSKPSLSDRLSDPPRRDKSASSKSRDRDRASHHSERNHRDERGPRYKGGYSR